MGTRGWILVVLGMGTLAGCESGPTEPGENVAYFPLAEGNRWTYAPEDPVFGDPFDWRVTERRGDTVALERPEGASHSGTVTLLDGLDEVSMLGEDGEPVPFYRFSTGASWVHHDPWECDDGATLLAVQEPEPVVTPAGTFEGCIRVERRTTASCTDAGTTVEWWAPGVGLVQWQELNFWAGGPLTYHLVDYSLD